MSKNVKPPTSYSQQIVKLQQKGIVINDIQDCESFLAQVNYYRFSGYILPFIDSTTGVCSDSINFSTLKGIYEFDAELRSMITRAIERIEVYIRAQLAYFHAHRYNSLGYMDATNYNKKHKHATFLDHVNTCIKENSRTPVVMHHTQVYGGSFPIWVIIEYFSLGMLSYFYADLKNPDKAVIAKKLYHANYQMLESWLHCLTDLRNRCAHYSRLYYWNFASVPNMGNFPYVCRLPAETDTCAQLDGQCRT